MGKEIQERLLDIRKGYTRTRSRMEADIDEGSYPLQAEPALIHPGNTSVVKIRDKGVIDIFVGTDNGLRIDPVTRSITALSNTYRSHQQHETSETDRDRHARVGVNDTLAVGGHWTVKAGGNVHVEAAGALTLNAAKTLQLNAAVIDLNATEAIRMSHMPPHTHPELVPAPPPQAPPPQAPPEGDNT